ncbi:MAG: type IV secretion system protein TraC [Pseudomonadota bacterium]|nr:type IV secretion system protein TraC [Pseudomonadota bacterium]
MAKSSFHATLSNLVERERAEDLFPPLAYDPDTKLFLVEGNPDKGSFLSACLVGNPLYGADDSTVERLRSTLAGNYPPGTMIQINLLSTPDIEPWVADYTNKRINLSFNDKISQAQKEILERHVANRSSFIQAGAKEPIYKGSKLLNNMTLVITITVPCSLIPTDKEMSSTNELINKLNEGLGSINVYVERVDAGEYLGLVRRIFSMCDGSAYDNSYDDSTLLREQILSPGDNIDVGQKDIHINDNLVRVMSVRQFPRQTSFAIMGALIGDPNGVNNQLTLPWMMSLTIHYPDQRAKCASVRNKSQLINYQAYGPMLRFIPRLAYKKHGFDTLIHSMEDGEMVVEMNFSLALFAPKNKQAQLDNLAGSVKTYYSMYQLEIAEEKYIAWPVFWNMVPMFPSSDSIKNLHRYKSMGVKHAVQFAPLVGEWRGTQDGSAMLMTSRRGQPVMFDLYDSPTNFNGIVFAESGAGKSFFTQQMIMDYLSTGSRVWVCDVGRSYEKLSNVVDGEFIEFSERSQICLNPFTHVRDIDEESDLLKSIVAKMASPSASLDDFLVARIEESIRAVWGRLGNNMTVTDIWDYLLQQEDPRLRDLGGMLFPWTRSGSYGSWFEGENNLQFNNNFIVLELEELKNKKQLQQVVLLMIISMIQHDMYLSGSDMKKILIIDEAWDLLDDPGVAKFMEHGYRRFRKYGGASIIVTQSISDLYSSNNGRAITENSAHQFVLQQKTETIANAEKEGMLVVEPYAFKMMKGVHTLPGVYSEIMINAPAGWGISRLVVDRFSQVMFSTSGKERTQVLSDMHKGDSAVKAIEQYIENE